MTIVARRKPRLPKKSAAARFDNRRGEPAWDVALLFPTQGNWTEEEYLSLEDNGANRMIELADGCIEVLPMPDPFHQRIVLFLFRKWDGYFAENSEIELFVAPLPIRLWEKQMREPDIVVVHSRRIKNARKPPEGADLAMEIVSPGEENRERDLDVKRKEYARAKISEYWIVDPEEKRITVLTLSGKSYKIHGEYEPGDVATSKLFPGFAVSVAEVFAAGAGR